MPDKMSYVESHPWLKFHIDLRNLPLKTWIQLGECGAKCDNMSGVPLKPNVKKNLQLIYLTKGVRATTAIEGNTLSEEEVRRIIEKESQIPPSKEYLEQEIENVLKACNLVAEHVRDNINVVISSELICEYNSIILGKLLIDSEIEPGRFRKHRVVVGRYLGPNPSEVPYLMEKLCNWLNGEEFKPTGGINPIVLAILKAIVAHVYLAWIHPFGDGNGRTARLIEFKILAQSGVPLPAAHLLSDFYNNTRTEYYGQLDKTSRIGGIIDDFVSYAVQGFFDGLNSQFEIIRSQQIEVAMENYIHEMFRDLPGEISKRRRHLALDILAKEVPVTKGDILLISRRTNDAYRNKGNRAISRDLSALRDMQLINITDDLISINLSPIIAFLPIRKN